MTQFPLSFPYSFYEPTQPPAVSDLSISDSSTEDELTLSWSSVSSADGYYVYRAQSSGSSKSDYTQIANISTTGYTDTGLEDGEEYFYVVTSYSSSDGGLVDLTTFTPSSSTSYTMNDCGFMDYTLVSSSAYNENQEAYFNQDGAHNGDNFKGIQKSIDLSPYTTLDYTTKVEKIDGPYDQVVVEVGSNRIFETASDTGPGVHGYTNRTYDVSGINSTVDVKFGHNVSRNRCRNVVSRFTDIKLT